MDTNVNNLFYLFYSIGLLFFSCGDKSSEKVSTTDFPAELVSIKKEIITGAERLDQYLPGIKGKRVGLVVNHSALVKDVHLIDTLLSLGVDIRKVFALEHGFRGDAPDGEHISDQKDPRTGLPVVSIYGKTRKPTLEMLQGLDVIVFDIQDVGLRCYTYLSTMYLVMQACAEENIPLVVLDRPNPNGHYVDGPMLDTAFRSFVGMIEVPLVHGMTFGELARMINGEGWLGEGLTCDLMVVTSQNYDHGTFYQLPVRPSPNLPNMRSVYLYPSLVLFEGTIVSIGRGTDFPFQVCGYPGFDKGTFSFTPQPNSGSKYPKHMGKTCQGFDLRSINLNDFKRFKELNLSYLFNFYSTYTGSESFFLKTNYIDRLAGTDRLRKQILEGKSEEEIRAAWEEELKKFRENRRNYLLYPDFE